MTSMRISRSGQTVLVPPQLPSYLLDTYSLRSITGEPTDEDVKTIHAIIRSLNSVAHIPALFNPDLSMQLSQHLFGAQMAVYRTHYSTALLPGDRSTYTPPALPSHVPGVLKQVVGIPSLEEIKSVQGVARILDNLAINLNMKVSQHLFNLQFARYMNDSSEGQFVSATDLEEPHASASQSTQQTQNAPPNKAPHAQSDAQNATPVFESELVPKAPSELAQLGETLVNAIKDSTSETKGVLKNIDRMLTLIKMDQNTSGSMDKYYHIYKNPLNKQGIAASECDLPRLCYGYYQSGYKYDTWLSSDHIAGYLKFFGIGTHLVQDGNLPKLIGGKEVEAKKLLLEHTRFC